MTEPEAHEIWKIARGKEEETKTQVSLTREAVLLEARIVAALVDHSAIKELKNKLAAYDEAQAAHMERSDAAMAAFDKWTSHLLSKHEAPNV